MGNVVVIGGSGFIGKALVAQLVKKDVLVMVVSRSAGGRRDTPGVQYRSGDVTDAACMLELLEGATVVYDLSMNLGATWEECERYCVGGARNVAQACLKHGVSRLIYTSSISALYMGAGGTMDESAGPDSQLLKRGFYPRSKILAERLLLEMHAKEGLPVVIFRPGVVLGTGGALVHGALGDVPSPTCISGYGNGKHRLPCVLVDDVASALVLAKDAPAIEGRTFNLAGDVRPTAAEYVALLRERTKRDFRFYSRSVWSMGLAEWSRWALKALARKSDNSAVPYRDTKSVAMATDLDCSLAKRLLGWKPVADRDEFIRRAIDCNVRPILPGDLRNV